MKARRTKAFVCVDVDFAEHRRFQATKDIDAAIGTWLRCLAHSRAQHQDGVVTDAWLRRTFPKTHYRRVEELVAVGLLLQREDGDYEIHAYAPRNQTRAAMEEERAATRERVREWRRAGPSKRADVTRYTSVTEPPVTANEPGCNASVPTSTSSSPLSSLVSLPSSVSLPAFSSFDDSINVRAVPRADGHAARDPLPASERGLSGPLWLAAFSEGIRAHTGRPCTVGRFYLGTLERIVTHHAPERDPARATEWLRAEANAFALLWDGKHPAKGLTPDGLERWLNEGRQRPPVFGRPRIVQPPAEEWHADDWSDLGAEVSE